jgi:hypothetical protein
MPRRTRSDDPILVGYISLSKAFDRYYRAVTPNWHELDAAINAANPPEGKINDAAAVSRKLDIARAEAFNARDGARSKADKEFRMAIATGELRPMIRDPVTGDLLRVSQTGWDRPTSGFPAGIEDDFVEPGDLFQPGPPDTFIRGQLRPVFFDEEEFEEWFAGLSIDTARAAPKVGPTGGRPSSMKSIETELDRWIDGGAQLVLQEMRRWEPARDDTRSIARLARALSKWCAQNGGDTAQSTIEKQLSAKLHKALALI